MKLYFNSIFCPVEEGDERKESEVSHAESKKQSKEGMKIGRKAYYS